MNSALRQIFLLALLVTLAQCKSTAPKPVSSAEPVTQIPPLSSATDPVATQLTFEGDNGEGYFSADGTKLIFQSKKRPDHENSQIYVLDLKTKKERRVTHNDGDDTCAYFAPNGKRIIYASTTDEIKEHPEPSPTPSGTEPGKDGRKKYEWRFLNYEIYQADPDGSNIVRLTHSPGYDAEDVYSYDGKKILFTSIRDGDLELYSMDANGHHQKRLTFMKGYDGGGFYSPNGKMIVWRGFHDGKGSAELYVSDQNGKNIKQLTTKGGINWCPFWSPDGKKILFSSNRQDPKNFDLYLINADGTCLKRLTNSPGAEVLPVFSPDGKQIAFTSDRSGTNQIYMMDFGEPKDCLPGSP